MCILRVKLRAVLYEIIPHRIGFTRTFARNVKIESKEEEKKAQSLVNTEIENKG